MRILIGTGLALALSTTAAITGTAQTGGSQTQSGRVVILPHERAFTADVSADGRLAAIFTQPFGRGTPEAPARIEIRNLQTGERTTLAGGVSDAGTPGRPAAVLSPDARSLAYTWLDPQLKGTGLLQVIGVEKGAQPRTLIPADPSDIGIIPHAWSPDGRRILVLIHGPSASMDRDPTSLAWVNVADGTKRTIKTLEPWRDGAMASPRLSRNGRWIAYSAVVQQGSDERAIYVVDAENGAERPIAKAPGSSSSPVWSPDGAYVISVNRQHGSLTSDLLALDASAPAAAPVLLEKGFSGAPVAVSTDGTLYSMEFDWGWRGLVLQLAAPGGTIVEQFSGHGVSWLQNDRLVFGRDGVDVVVRTLRSGVERGYSRGAVSGMGPRVFSDASAAVLYIPASGGHTSGFYRLDFASGTFTRLLSRMEGERVRSFVSALSPDDQTLFLIATSKKTGATVTATAVGSGRERRVLELPASVPPVQGISVSPDGRSLALHASDGRIFTARVESGELREVVPSSPGGGWSEVLQWSRDGLHIIYGVRSSPTATDWRLMRVKAIGGAPEAIDVDSSVLSTPGRLLRFEFSPDGERVALSVRQEPRFEVSATPLSIRR